MENIKFSIIISTHNMGYCVQNAINSILMQTFQDYEVIVYDDASNDDTESVVKSITDNRVKYIYSSVNVGLGQARNNAFKESKGEYILYVDADDSLYDESSLAKIYEVMEKEKPDLAYFGIQYVGGSNKQYLPNQSNSTKQARILCDIQFSVCSKCWKRKFLEEKKIAFVSGMYYEDMVYSMKSTILAEKIAYGEFPIYKYYRNGCRSITTTPNIQKCSDMFRMLACIMDLFDITPEEYQPYLYSFIRQEADSSVEKIKEIIKAYKNKTNTPIFPKRNYEYSESDGEILKKED